ncbi:MAG: hypothetical protein R3219_08195, partial [Hydrogenovibrio sp.]|nr:hypothetical protein [Hydrogenovibrio sp.]
GLNYDNAVDGWQYPIVYAVNQSATTNACGDIPHQASNYFCAISPGPNFDLTTPPTQSVSGKGGYAICSGQAKDCLAGSDYYADEQVAVLVAFNQNGLLEQYHCGQQSQKEKENCDLDAFFWAGNREGQEGKFFDDQVLGVSSYQLKSVFLQHDPSALQPN